MKKTTYLIIGFTIFLLILSFFAPVILFENSAATTTAVTIGL